MPIRPRLLPAAPTAGNQPPVIGYHSVFVQTGTFVTTGTDYANALDGLTYDGWLTTATGAVMTFTGSRSHDCDYFGVAGHNLHQHGGTISLEYYNGAAWVELAACAPGTSSPFMQLFTKVTSNQYRVTVACTSAATIGVVMAGRRLTMPHGNYVGFGPFPLQQATKLYTAQAQRGQILGRSTIRSGYSGTFDIDFLDPQWMRDTFQAFITHARDAGWFLLWNPARHPNEAAYCMTTGDVDVQNSRTRYMAARIPFEARV